MRTRVMTHTAVTVPMNTLRPNNLMDGRHLWFPALVPHPLRCPTCAHEEESRAWRTVMATTVKAKNDLKTRSGRFSHVDAAELILACSLSLLNDVRRLMNSVRSFVTCYPSIFFGFDLGSGYTLACFSHTRIPLRMHYSSPLSISVTAACSRFFGFPHNHTDFEL